jgi:hypothetical protein
MAMLLHECINIGGIYMKRHTDVSEIVQVLKETAAIVEKFGRPISQIDAEVICNHRIAMRGIL